MEEILNRIANILNSNSEATIISLVVTAIAAFAAFITALASLFTVNINKKMLTRMQETDRITSYNVCYTKLLRKRQSLKHILFLTIY